MDGTFSISTIADLAVLHCRGDLDLGTRVDLAGWLADLSLTSAPRVAVDLAETTFLDCGSVGVLEVFVEVLTPPRSLVVVCPPGLARRVLAITDFEKTNHVVPTLSDALS